MITENSLRMTKMEVITILKKTEALCVGIKKK